MTADTVRRYPRSTAEAFPFDACAQPFDPPDPVLIDPGEEAPRWQWRLYWALLLVGLAAPVLMTWWRA